MTTARERARTATTREILDEARRQLAEHGAAGLSLRSVARAVGMVSSAVYRYVPSRDDLLTMLVTEAYDAVGERAETARADAVSAGASPRAQWRAVWRAVRTWALAHPAEYALVYGSPVPGYAAPSTTIAAGTRVGLVLVAIVAEHGGPVADPGPAVRGALEPGILPELDPTAAPAALVAWTQLFGVLSFELFGQYVNAVADRGAWFDHVADTAATAVGLPPG